MKSRIHRSKVAFFLKKLKVESLLLSSVNIKSTSSFILFKPDFSNLRRGGNDGYLMKKDEKKINPNTQTKELQTGPKLLALTKTLLLILETQKFIYTFIVIEIRRKKKNCSN